MLQGTLDVFTIDEVLGLLASASKTGVLRIDGDRGTGGLQVESGQLVAGIAAMNSGPGDVESVTFELLRFAEGSFVFEADDVLGIDVEPAVSVTQTLASAHDRLREWRSIESVVPSLSHRLNAIQAIETEEITLSKSEWATVVAVGEGADVGVAAERLGLGEVDGSRQIMGLVERGVLSISDPADGSAAAPATATTATAAPVRVAPVAAPAAPDPVPESSTPSVSEAFQSDEPVSPSQPDPLSPLTDLASFTSAEVDAHMIEADPVADATNLDSAFARTGLETTAFSADADESIPPMPAPPETNDAPPVPPSPDEIATFGATVSDAASLTESAETAEDEVPDADATTDDGAFAAEESGDATESKSDEGSLLMRYLRSNS